MIFTLVSHYSSKNQEHITQFSVPIYQSINGSTYSDWISNWSSHLIAKVKTPEILAIFIACKAILKKDPTCALFLLPYILCHILGHGSPEDHDEIICEMDAIIGNEQEKSKITLNGSILAEEKHNSVAEDLGILAKQTIFTVIDHMNKWVTKKYEFVQAHMRKNQDIESELRKNKDYVNINQFRLLIKKSNLALASFKCKAYAR